MKKIFAIDLGTTKFCLGSLQYTKHSKPIVDIVSVNSSGMNRGMISDFYSAQKSLASLLDLAEKEFNTRIDKVCLGVSGTHLKSRFVSAQVPIDDDRIIKPKTLEKIKEEIRLANHSEKKELIHIAPCGYQIDDREWIINPIGFSGTHLSAKFFIIEADRFYLSDLVRLCNSCGIRVMSLVSEQYASSHVTLSSSQKDLGVVLVDIGGGTSDGIIFLNGKPSKVFTISIGGNLMTKDISIGLGLSFEEAERIKILSGLSGNISTRPLEAQNIHGKSVNLDTEDLKSILEARIAELTELISQEIQTLKPLLQGGLVLTGGGSDVIGMSSFLQHRLMVPVTHMQPSLQSLISMEKETRFPSKHATILGLLYHEYSQRHSTDSIHFRSHPLVSPFHKFIKWMHDLY